MSVEKGGPLYCTYATFDTARDQASGSGESNVEASHSIHFQHPVALKKVHTDRLSTATTLSIPGFCKYSGDA